MQTDPSNFDPVPTQALRSPQNMITAKETASRLGVSPATVSMRIKEGRLHPVRMGRNVFLNPDEVTQELERVARESKGKRDFNKARYATSVPKPPKVPGLIEQKKIEPNEQVPLGYLSYTGEQCAEAVAILLAGGSQLDLISKMKITWETADHFYRMYLKLQPGFYVSPKGFAKLRALLQWTESPPTEDGFFRAFQIFIMKETKADSAAPLVAPAETSSSSPPETPTQEAV